MDRGAAPRAGRKFREAPPVMGDVAARGNRRAGCRDGTRQVGPSGLGAAVAVRDRSGLGWQRCEAGRRRGGARQVGGGGGGARQVGELVF